MTRDNRGNAQPVALCTLILLKAEFFQTYDARMILKTIKAIY